MYQPLIIFYPHPAIFTQVLIIFVGLKTSLWHTIRDKLRFIYMDEVLYLSFWRDSRDSRGENHENKADKCFRFVRFKDYGI